MKIRCDNDETFTLRTSFKFKQAQYGMAIIRVAAQAIAGFGRISDEAAALNVRDKPSG